MNEWMQRFFREPRHLPSDMARVVIGGLGVLIVLVLGILYPAYWFLVLLGIFFSLHYLFSGLAEKLPREQVQASGVLRLLALLASLGGLLSAVLVLVLMSI